MVVMVFMLESHPEMQNYGSMGAHGLALNSTPPHSFVRNRFIIIAGPWRGQIFGGFSVLVCLSVGQSVGLSEAFIVFYCAKLTVPQSFGME